MTLKEAQQLRPGSHVDHRDDVGRFVLATVIQKDESKLKIHYDGWNPYVSILCFLCVFFGVICHV